VYQNTENANGVIPVDGSGVVQPISIGDTSGSGTITSINGAVTVTTAGCSIVVFNVTGTWSATVQIEGTTDGTTFFGVPSIANFGGIVTNFVGNNQYVVNCGGFKQVRLRASAYTSGTVAIAYNAGIGSNIIQVVNLTGSNLHTQVDSSTLPTGAATDAKL